MKKIILGMLLISTTGLTRVNAQLHEGGIPIGLQLNLKDQYIPTSTSALPDWKSTMDKNEKAEAEGKQQPYLLALFTPADVIFPASGTFLKTDNGHQIWVAQIKIDGAPASGLYYDKFQLPKGVRYYVRNANGSQILGAYTINNNAPSKEFAHEPVQGSVINLEMDIEPGVNPDDIEMHINRAAVYFRGVEYLSKFSIDPSNIQEINTIDTALTGGSSVCMINAICPLGLNYATQRKATLQTLLPVGQGVAACSATMINNTGNTTTSCKPYLLTATHCDQDNSMTTSHFDQLIIRFNFEQAACNSNEIPESNTMNGANFIARANYNETAPVTAIKGDFLLLELRQTIPANWNVTLAGWNNAANLPLTVTAPKKLIGFHHPNADVKKVSSAQQMESTNLQQTAGDETHWVMLLDSGLVSTGSSGSGLFDGDGYLIGIASVAGPVNLDAACTRNAANDSVGGTANAVFYSKLAYDWNYTVDGSAANRKLMPWLDPANTGVVTLNPVKSDCTALDGGGGGTGVTANIHSLDNSIRIYPNPTTNGIINVALNLNATADITMDLYDINGKKLRSYQLHHVQSGSYVIDLSNYANGMYLLKYSDGNSMNSKKIMLSK